MSPVPDLAAGTILSDTYVITQKLGEGGMGSVYRADHQRLPRPFAIKVLNDVVQPDSEFYHRFRREAEICSRLRHENIVEVVDFNFTPDGRPFIAMELLEGEDLDERLRREGRLSLTATLEIVAQVAAGLTEAHEQGVIHRDLKPQNIFLSQRRRGSDLVKIVDFGISKIQDSVSMLTAASSLMGTPYYMSPEQTGGGDGRITERSDVYALGVITYQMLSGQMPIVGDNLAVLVNSINTKPPRPLRDLVPEISPAVETVIDVALAKDPMLRFRSAADFYEAFWRAAEIGNYLGTTSSAVAQTTLPDSPRALAPAEVAAAATAGPIHTSAYDASAFHAPPPVAGAPGGGPSAAPAATPTPATENLRGPHPAVAPRPVDVASAQTTLSSAAGEAPGGPDLPRRPASRGAVIGLGIALVALLGAGVTWYALSGRGSDGPRAAGQAPSAAPKSAPSADGPPRRAATPPATRGRPAPTRVVIRLAGLPAGARCTVDGGRVEGNPLVIPRGQHAVRLTCEAAGHHAHSTDVIPDRDRTIPLRLEPRRAAAKARPRRRPSVQRPRDRPRRPRRPPMSRRKRPIDSDVPIE